MMEILVFIAFLIYVLVCMIIIVVGISEMMNFKNHTLTVKNIIIGILFFPATIIISLPLLVAGCVYAVSKTDMWNKISDILDKEILKF